MTYFDRAIKDRHSKIAGEGKQQKILYLAINQTERFSDPEDQVRGKNGY